MKIRKFTGSPDDWRILHEICFSCGSRIVKKSYKYLRFANNISNAKFFCDIADEDAFFAAILNKTHVRLFDIAVRTKAQKKGLGQTLLQYEITKFRSWGIREMTFRTPMNENAITWWRLLGAVTVGRKNEDWEMRLRF